MVTKLSLQDKHNLVAEDVSVRYQRISCVNSPGSHLSDTCVNDPCVHFFLQAVQEKISRAKAQSAAAFLRVIFAPLRLCVRNSFFFQMRQRVFGNDGVKPCLTCSAVGFTGSVLIFKVRSLSKSVSP